MRASILTIVWIFLIQGLLQKTASFIIPRASQNTYKALYSFTSQATGEVDLQKGDIVNVLQQDTSGWWLIAKLDGSDEGWTPASYLSKVSPAANPPSLSSKTRSTSTTTTHKSSKTSKASLYWPSTSSARHTHSSSSINGDHIAFALSSSCQPSFQGFGQSFLNTVGGSKTAVSTTKDFAIVKTPTSAISSFSSIGSLSKMAPLTISSDAMYNMAGVASTLNINNAPGSTMAPSSTLSTSSVDLADLYADAGVHSTMAILGDPTGGSSAAASIGSPADCMLNCDNSNIKSVGIQANPSSASGAISTAVPPECADPGGVNGVTMACWNSLEMTQYIKSWWTFNRPKCHTNTSFGQCFLQLLDIGMNDCVSISSGTCPPPSWIQFKDHNISVRDFYVAYNIYAVWTFFNSYWSAIGNARGAASDSIAAIVALLDPPKTNNAELSNINFALAIGLTFVKIEGFGPVAEALVGVAVNAAKQAPQVARYLFPGPPGDTKFVELGQISNQMGTLTVNLQGNVAQALTVIQNDTSTFLSFTGTGAFSNNPVVSMSQQSTSLLTALNTYVISLCLEANNWQISRAIDTDVNALMSNGTKLTWNLTDCGTGYNDQSICGAYYWNKTADVSYTLTNTDDMFQNPAPIMQQIFANWTTPELLFNGALQCQMQKGAGQPEINPQGGDISATPCLSSVKICTWDLNPSHFGTQYEYTDCDVQNNLATQGCSGCDATTDFCTNVPSSYLGGYLLNDLADGPQYVYCNDAHSLTSTN